MIRKKNGKIKNIRYVWVKNVSFSLIRFSQDILRNGDIKNARHYLFLSFSLPVGGFWFSVSSLFPSPIPSPCFTFRRLYTTKLFDIKLYRCIPTRVDSVLPLPPACILFAREKQQTETRYTRKRYEFRSIYGLWRNKNNTKWLVDKFSYFTFSRLSSFSEGFSQS